MTSPPPDVSVLLGTYNRLEHLQAAIASIREARGRYSCEIVVTDGGSTDGSREWLAIQPDVVLVAVRELEGAVRAFNQAFAVSRGRYVANFNDDAQYVGLALEQALDVLEHADSRPIGQVALAFDLRGYWTIEAIHSRPYANFGVERREVAQAVAQAQGGPDRYWNPIYRTYGADCEHSCWVWKLGFRVEMLSSAHVHDRNVQDALRALNDRQGDASRPRGHDRHPDSALFWERWGDAKSLDPIQTTPELRPGVKLHLGCGPKHLAGWLNVDGIPSPGADAVLDLYELARLPSKVAAEVYWCHGPEHIHEDRLPWLWGQLHRILRPGGRLRVATVDLVKAFENRVLSDKDGPAFNAALYGEALSTDHPFLAHRTGFTARSLWESLYAAGFHGLRHWKAVEHPEIAALHDYSACDLVTLNVEARRPEEGAVVQPGPLPRRGVSSDAPMGGEVRMPTVPPEAMDVPRPPLQAGIAVGAPVRSPDPPPLLDASLEDIVVGVDRPPPVVLVSPSGFIDDEAILPVPGRLPPWLPPGARRAERVLHLALHDPGTAEEQPSLKVALRSLCRDADAYREIDWVKIGPDEARRQLLLQCEAFRPTLVFGQIQTPGVMTPECLRGCKEHLPPEAVVVLWNGDLRECESHPSMRWQVECGEAADLTLVTNTAGPRWLAARGVAAGYLQIGYDPDRYRPDAPGGPSTPAVVFLGSNYQALGYDAPLRQELAVRLYEATGGEFAAYGYQWSGPWARARLRQHEEAPVYCKAALAVGVSLHNDVPRYTSDRTMRALGSGAVYAIKWFPDMEGLGLVDGVNCLVWNTVDDLVGIAMDWIRPGRADARALLRAAAHSLAVSVHTWDYRMGELAAILEEFRRRQGPRGA